MLSITTQRIFIQIRVFNTSIETIRSSLDRLSKTSREKVIATKMHQLWLKSIKIFSLVAMLSILRAFLLIQLYYQTI